MIRIEINDQGVLREFERLRQRGGNLRPALLEIGEDLAHSTKQRFQSSTAPDGSPWAANKPTTLARYVAGSKSNFTKGGELSKRGQARLTSKKPLVGRSKMLSHTIGYRLQGGDLLVGSPMIYASTQQFGAKQGEFGHSRRGPIPWGDIPARPFLGLSPEDVDGIERVVRRYLMR
jgi:phage virion morphogenesis protein